MIKAGFRGNFSSTMAARIDKWSSQTIKATIIVPPELQWWAYQEYGVKPHPIQARNESLLVLPGPVFKEIVAWAPTTEYEQGTHTVRTVIAALPQLSQEFLAAAFSANSDNPEAVKAVFVTDLMTEVKRRIVEQMTIDLPGFREPSDGFPAQGGKLGGRTASEVFDELATIEAE